MSDYRRIAAFYDQLNGNVNYSAFAAFYEAAFARFLPEKPEIVLDLACGTGTLTALLQENGYDMIGVDGSPEMLGEAMDKFSAMEKRPLLLCQDLTELDLYGTIDACVCCLDGLNSLSAEILKKALAKVSLFTVPGGLFIFDLNSPYKFSEIFGQNTYVYDTDQVYCVWQNHWDEKCRECDFELTYFVKEEEGYFREDEIIREYCYEDEWIKEALDKAGFDLMAVCGDFDFSAPKENSERIFYVAKKR